MRALSSRSDELLAGGAAFGGKSQILLMKGLYPMQLPTGRSLILRATFPQVRELIDRAKAKFPEAGAVWNAQDKRFTFPSGATYEFGYGRTLDELYSQYTGGEWDFIGYDEAGFLESEECIDLLASRLRSKDGRLFTQLMLTANPGQPLHAILKRRYVTATDKGKRVATVPVTVEIDGKKREIEVTREFVQMTAADNPEGQLKNPRYMARLAALPELRRKQLLEGDWDSSSGLYFDELNDALHRVEPFEIPPHWEMWGAFDWGFAHPFAGGAFAASPDGTVFLVDSVHGWRKGDDEIAHRLKETLPRRTWGEIHAGHDCWDKPAARTGRKVESTAETFEREGLVLVRAAISRIPGWRNVRQGITPRTGPRFYIFDTPGNRETLRCLESLVPDPKDPEDVHKVNADPETGEGGDDPADMVRYGLAKRQFPAVLPDAPAPRDPNRDPVEFRPRDEEAGEEPGDPLFPGLPAGF